MKGRFLLCALGALLLAALPAAAHPHVFISNRMTVVFDQGRLKGINFSWTFDDMFSAMILTDYKPNAEGAFSPQVTRQMKTGAFDNLENYHYFLAFFVGNKPMKRFPIEQFTPSVVEKKLVYSFFVPLDLPVRPEEQSVRVTVYDGSYYVAFDLLHVENAAVQAGTDVATVLSVEKTKVRPLWPGQYMPDNLVIRFKESS